MYEKAASENENMLELRAIVNEITSSRKRNYNVNSSHGTISTESSTHSSANPPSDYENNGKNPSQQRSRASSSTSKRTTPASSLNTSDDYVVTTALQTNRAPMSLSEIRSPQTQKRYGYRDAFTPHYYRAPAVYDDVARPSASIRDDYAVYDDVPDTFVDNTEPLRQSLNFQGQINSSLADDDTTDDEIVRPTTARKSKRKPLNIDQLSPKQSPARRTLTAPIPSSGYQSQNHSSSSSSSSPVESTNHPSTVIRDQLITASTHPMAVAQTSIKFSNNSSQNYPSATTTSYSSTSSQSHNNDDEFGEILSTTPQRRPSSSGDFYNRYNGTTNSNTSEASNGFEPYTRSPQ